MARIENGAVQAVSTKMVKTRFGEKPTFSFNVNGEWFSTGFKDAKIAKGDVITFNYNPGKYGNEAVPDSVERGAVALTPPTTSAPARSPSGGFGGKGVFPIPALDGQRSIVRQNALTNARELYCARTAYVGTGYLSTYELDADSIIGLARKFEAYTAGDLDLEEVESELEKKAA